MTQRLSQTAWPCFSEGTEYSKPASMPEWQEHRYEAFRCKALSTTIDVRSAGGRHNGDALGTYSDDPIIDASV
jgi:hypothetical protein